MNKRMRALERKVSMTRDIYIAAVRGVLDARKERCCDDCPGWIVSVVDRFPGVEIEACDECSQLNGGYVLADQDIEALPEAQDALYTHPATRGEDPDAPDVYTKDCPKCGHGLRECKDEGCYHCDECGWCGNA